MKRLLILLFCFLILALPCSVSAQDASEETLDVGVKPFKMGRSIINWWQTFEAGQQFRPNWIIASYVAEGLTNSKRWNCVTRMELNDVVDELNLGQSGLVRSETAAETGNLIGARFLVTGLVNEFNLIESGSGVSVTAPISWMPAKGSLTKGGRVRVSCSVKVIDTETGSYVAAVTSSKECKIDDGGFALGFLTVPNMPFSVDRKGGEVEDYALGKCMKDVATDLCMQLETVPIKKVKARLKFNGTVVHSDDTAVFIDLGPKDNLKKNTMLRVFREVELKDKKGNVLRTIKKSIGQIKVVVVDEVSECAVIDCKMRIEPNDIVTSF